MKIIDISKYQGNVDFAKVKASGVEGVIIRAVSTNSGGLYLDPYFEQNYSKAKTRGLYVGAYYYSYALDKAYADKELNAFKNRISGKMFELPLVIDVEDGSQKNLGKDKLAELVKYALDTMESWGAYAMWYSYKSFIDYYINTDMLKNYDFWLRWYTSVQPKNYTYGIWQYTSQERIDGIAGNVDCNIAYKNYPGFIVGKFNDFREIKTEIVKTEPPVIDNTDAIQFLSTEPVKMCIGYASNGDLNTIVNLISSLSIESENSDGFIYTVPVSVGDQKTIISKCNELGVPYKEYVAVTCLNTEETLDKVEIEPVKTSFIKWLVDFILDFFRGK